MMDRENITEKLLLEHYRLYPKLQIEDIFKFLHQSSFGCEHFVTDLERATEYIHKEYEECSSGTKQVGCTTELLDGEYCRVHLDWIENGLDVKTLGKLFFLSAKHQEDGKIVLEEKLRIFLSMVDRELLPFVKEEVELKMAKWKASDYQACHHSDVFRSSYRPAYRVVKKEYVKFLSLFSKIDCMLKTGRVTLAIEGGSASGKTTLASLLETVYDSTIFHMDDFFLRPEQRTPERLARPGENVDWERFLDEVLLPLNNNAVIHYRRFDCRTFTLEQPIIVEASGFNVIEGAYSMHPKLAPYYDLSVFLDVPSKLQGSRIKKRNTPDMAERFFKEWIPLEHKYFEEFKVKERCDLVIDI